MGEGGPDEGMARGWERTEAEGLGRLLHGRESSGLSGACILCPALPSSPPAPPDRCPRPRRTPLPPRWRC